MTPASFRVVEILVAIPKHCSAGFSLWYISVDLALNGQMSFQGKRERAGAVINADKHVFAFTGDLSALLDRAATETVPPFRDDKASDQLSHRNAQVQPCFLHLLESLNEVNSLV